MQIPLVDLLAQNAEVADEVAEGFARVLASGGFIGGPEVAAFEQAYAEHAGVRHCIGVGNGTDAIELALRAAGVRPGDEVVVPANTFIATAEAVSRAGACPVFVDVDDEHLLLDPAGLEAVLGPRVRAVVPVHLFGQAAPVEAVLAVLADRDVAVVVDAAQSQGAARHGTGAGALGRLAATSFYPGKNLGAYGDAGAVLTDDGDVAQHVRALSQHGSTVKYEHPQLGFNSRLDALQAVVLSAKLRRLDAWNERRRAAAARYDELLADVPAVCLPRTLPGNVHAWHLYVVRVERRDEVLAELARAGIGAGVHYPVPVHLTGAYRGAGGQVGDHPVAERAAERILSLPLYPGITADQQERVAAALRAAVRR